MMSWFWENGNELFILFIFPLTGLAFDFYFDKKKTVYILFISLALFLPILTGYFYIISWLYQVFALIALSCLYSFYSKIFERKIAKIVSAIVNTTLLFLILGWFAFMDSFSGFEKVEKSWHIDGYKIEYVRSQGFAGGPLMEYRLNKYWVVPIFIKTVETNSDDETAGNCNIYFTESKIMFNKCNAAISKMP